MPQFWVGMRGECSLRDVCTVGELGYSYSYGSQVALFGLILRNAASHKAQECCALKLAFTHKYFFNNKFMSRVLTFNLLN